MTKPRSRADWRKMTDEERRKTPIDCYLKKSNRTYPYKVWAGSGWRISRLLLNSAITLAGLHGHTGVLHEAQRIKKREFGE
jgi:hypothetical protein